jgi:RNA polymerase sigma factor (sigma-70 family)
MLFEEHSDRVYGFALAMLRHSEDAEDVTQDVLIRLWEGDDDVPDELVGPWLMRVTRNACIGSQSTTRSLECSSCSSAAIETSSSSSTSSAISTPNRSADDYRTALRDNLKALGEMVPRSIRNEIDRTQGKDVWAEISHADVLFLKEDARIRRVVRGYLHAIPIDQPFAWDAARGQLDLFRSLGIRKDLADQVIEAIDSRFEASEPEKTKKSVHLVIVAGHRIDEPERSTKRFPAASEERARDLLHAELNGLRADSHDLIVVASASAGTDIVTHELCDELGIPSSICLPMPAERFSSAALTGHAIQSWRSRFLSLIKSHETLVLCEREGLPRWQQNSDGNDASGTAQIVGIAEDAGNIDIRIIDSAQL